MITCQTLLTLQLLNDHSETAYHSQQMQSVCELLNMVASTNLTDDAYDVKSCITVFKKSSIQTLNPKSKGASCTVSTGCFCC